MKKQFFAIFISTFLLTNLISNTAYSQDWNAVNLMITSQEGMNACHKTGKFYNFDFRITLPPVSTTNIAGVVITETYTIVTTPSGLETMVSDAHGRESIYRGNRWEDYQNFGTNATGTVEVAYQDSWNEPNISLRLGALVRFTRTRKVDDGPVVITADQTEDFLEIFNFTLQPTLPNPQNILIDGTPSTQMSIDPVSGCKVYTLTAPSVPGADRYRWVLPNSAWLVSPSSSLTSNSIQIQPTWTNSASNNIGNITLEAIQDCDGEHKSSVIVPVKISRPIIVANQAALCSNQGVTTLSIPSSVGLQTTFNWAVDANKVDIVSGQNSPSAQFRAKGDFATNTTINLVITTPCGSISTHKILWVGRPTVINPNCIDNPVDIPAPSSNCITRMCRTYYYTTENRIVAEATGMNAVTNWQWSRLSNNYAWVIYGNVANIQPNQYGIIAFRVRAQNACGWSNWAPHQITVPRNCNNNDEDGPGDGFEFRSAVVPSSRMVNLYPNPVSSTLYLELENFQQLNSTARGSAELLDLLGFSRMKVRIEDAQAQIDVSKLPKGTYVLRIIIDGQIENHQVVIE